MTEFSAFGLPETLMKALTNVGFTTPTPIQAQAIPFALAGRDVLGSAATGTGKTAAFSLPLIAHLIAKPQSTALIMTPTRELATQVLSTIQPFLQAHREIKAACLIGGESMGKQMAQLGQKPRLIVGTPGRINDHLARGSVNFDRSDFLVLDETDRMLDMGFGPQIEKIITRMAKKRQTLMFSATLPPQIVKMSGRYLNNPERVSVNSANKPAANIKQETIYTKDADKYDNLMYQLKKREGSIIVFVKTKRGADRLATKLCREDHLADAIHGDLQQRRRDRAIQNFRDKKFRILVATDVAARGLDVPHIEHVINYDLPQVPEDYIHRIGRTARAGAEGEAANLITPADQIKWNAILRLIDPEQAKRQPATSEKSSSTGKKKTFGNKGKAPWHPARKSTRSEESRDDRPKRNFADRPKRDFGDRPRQEGAPKKFGERTEWKPRESRRDENAGRDRDDRPKRNFDDRPKRDFGDRPREEGAPKKFGKKPFGAKPFGAKPGAGKKPFGKAKPFGFKKPAGSGSDRPRFAKKSG